MGNEQIKREKFSYVEETGEARPGESPVFRNKDFKSKLLVAPCSGIRTVQRMFQANFEQLSSREFLGFKPILEWRLEPEEGRRTAILEPEYSYFSFRGVEQKVRHLGAALQSKGLAGAGAPLDGQRLRLVGIHSEANVEQFMAEIACVCYGLVSVQVSPLCSEEELLRVWGQTQLQTVFVGPPQLPLYLKLIREKKLGSLKHLVVFDSGALFPGERVALDSLAEVRWHCFDDLLTQGSRLPQLPFPAVKPEDIMSLTFTSGTTGEPKPVLISHRNAVGFLAAVDSKVNFVHGSSVYFSYLPLFHIVEKMMFLAVSFKGGKYAVSRGGGAPLMGEMEAVRPTILVGSPAVFKEFARKVREQFEQLPGLASWYVGRAVRQMGEQVKAGRCEHSFLQRQVFRAVREAFGGKVEVLCSGSAIMDAATKTFLVSVLGCPLIEGYGSAETMGAAFFADPGLLGGSGLQGGPLPCLEFKLREAPQLGLLSDAKDVYDRPTPGGEILVRGTSVFESYFNNEPLTRAAVDEEGWFHTSDLGVLCPQTRGLKLLGSLHEAFKLQPGEFVFPQVLESVYQSAPLVKTIFVHGSPLHDRLVAVLNLDKEQAESLARDLNLPFPDYASLLASPQFVLAVKAQLEELARSHKLKAYERIHAVHLEPQGFFSLGLLSATLKLNRSKCKAHFDEIILRLYREN